MLLDPVRRERVKMALKCTIDMHLNDALTLRCMPFDGAQRRNTDQFRIHRPRQGVKQLFHDLNVGVGRR